MGALNMNKEQEDWIKFELTLLLIQYDDDDTDKQDEVKRQYAWNNLIRINWARRQLRKLMQCQSDKSDANPGGGGHTSLFSHKQKKLEC